MGIGSISPVQIEACPSLHGRGCHTAWTLLTQSVERDRLLYFFLGQRARPVGFLNRESVEVGFEKLEGGGRA